MFVWLRVGQQLPTCTLHRDGGLSALRSGWMAHRRCVLCFHATSSLAPVLALDPETLRGLLVGVGGTLL